ncbi:hypothetical protein NC651_000284 [Populus alba x Populus x berolinensis]|nr:hypothetical protein NC651_000284 [Populus alba x Populus x berolinensis]
MGVLVIGMVEEVSYNSMEGKEMEREVVVTCSRREVVAMRMKGVVIYNNMKEEVMVMEVVVTCSSREVVVMCAVTYFWTPRVEDGITVLRADSQSDLDARHCQTKKT